MIDKDKKYREELFELLKSNLNEVDSDEDVWNLIKHIFITNSDEINTDDIIKKITE